MVTRLDGSPVLVRTLEITNTGERPSALGRISPWSGIVWSSPRFRQNSRLPTNPSAAEPGLARHRIGYLRNDGWGEEGGFTWQELQHETFRIERTRGRNHGPPYFVLENSITGQRFFIHTYPFQRIGQALLCGLPVRLARWLVGRAPIDEVAVEVLDFVAYTAVGCGDCWGALKHRTA